MTARHVTTGVTLLLLSGLLAAGFLYGLDRLFAPIDEATPTAEPPAPVCSTVPKGKRLRAEQVTVNVYNGGTRAGLAGQTLEALTSRGFRQGDVGNAPKNNVQRVQVWVVAGEKQAGRLVALNFGPKTPVVVKRKDLGEGGVDVVVADGYKKLAKPRLKIQVRADQEVCDPTVLPEAS